MTLRWHNVFKVLRARAKPAWPVRSPPLLAAVLLGRLFLHQRLASLVLLCEVVVLLLPWLFQARPQVLSVFLCSSYRHPAWTGDSCITWPAAAESRPSMGSLQAHLRVSAGLVVASDAGALWEDMGELLPGRVDRIRASHGASLFVWQIAPTAQALLEEGSVARIGRSLPAHGLVRGTQPAPEHQLHGVRLPAARALAP